jgi:hypothetical protein
VAKSIYESRLKESTLMHEITQGTRLQSLCIRESKMEKSLNLLVRFCSKLRRIVANVSRTMNQSASFPAIGLDLIF